MAISLFITGDVVPRGILPELFKSNGKTIFREIIPYVNEADCAVVNMEAPMVNNLNPIKKTGHCLSMTPSTAEVLKDVGFDVFTFANNHFFDQGQKGVDSTLDKCEELGIKIVGGGKNAIQARKPLILNINDKRIAIINACEHEFSIANEEHGGSNPLDLIQMQEDITTMRKETDYIVLILHGGVEEYHYPTPRMKRWYRHFVDLGADAVVNHHQHCINGYEIYKRKPIFYGLGNFYFPWGDQSRPKSWSYGYAVKLKLDRQIDFELIPYKQTALSVTLRDKGDFEKEIELYNIPIHDEFLLQQKIDEFIIDKEYSLISQLLPSFMTGKFVSALIRHKLMGKIYNSKELYSIKNKISCESQLELLQRLFSILIM